MAFIHTIPGLERAEIQQYGYAVEYNYAPPTQLGPGLMRKAHQGLFLAGQINGTSGYEEAAAQGLMAGLNAGRYLRGQPWAVLDRSQVYIGVLITRGVDEPYRMFTSRAEHRLTLRESTAEARLTELADGWGLLPAARLAAAKGRAAARARVQEALERPVGAAMAVQLGLSPAEYAGKSRAELLRMPQVVAEALLPSGMPAEAAAEVTKSLLFAGYIAREHRWIERLASLEGVCMPAGLDFAAICGLSREVQEKLSLVQPTTLGQAGRSSSVTPAALATLEVAIQRAQLAKKTAIGPFTERNEYASP